MSKTVYIIKLLGNNEDLRPKNHLGYLWDASTRRIARFSKDEASREAKLYGAKVERIIRK